MERVLPPLPDFDSMSEEEALNKLEDYLKPRIESAMSGEISHRSVEKIFEDVRQELK